MNGDDDLAEAVQHAEEIRRDLAKLKNDMPRLKVKTMAEIDSSVAETMRRFEFQEALDKLDNDISS